MSNAPQTSDAPVRQRVRIRFRKEGDLRLISHKDLVRLMERLFRRAGLPLSMSEGFHPKPRMSYPMALAVGIAGLDEVMELELSEELTSDDVRRLMEPHLPPGLVLAALDVVPPGTKKAQVHSVTFELPLPQDRLAEAALAADRLREQPSAVVQRDEGRGPVDVRSFLLHVSVVDGKLRFQLRVTPLGSARPREVLRAMGLEELELDGFQLVRTTVELEP